MKFTKLVEVHFNIKSVIIDVNPRYIDEEELEVPMLNGGQWRVEVDLETGVIDGWPIGEERGYYWKICDEGSYHLVDETGIVVGSINNNYVPNKLLPGEWGDYLELKINKDGVITNWLENPSFEEFQEDE